MSTGNTTTIVWAHTDHGDIPTLVIDPAMLATIVDEALSMRDVGTVEIEVDGTTVARGSWDDLDEIDGFLAGGEVIELPGTPAPLPLTA